MTCSFMFRPVSLLALLWVLIAGCAAPPPQVKEAACTRQVPSALSGQTFVFPAQLPVLSYLRENKAMFANHNRFIDSKSVAGRRATILCAESVPGPKDIPQHVLALKVDGIDRPFFANDAGILGILWEQENAVAYEEARVKLQRFISRPLWSKPSNWGYRPDLLIPGKGISIGNLQPATVTAVDVVKDATFSNRGRSVRVTVRTNNAALVQLYEKDAIELYFELNWHTQDPRLAYPNIPASSWADIEKGYTRIGMTSAMVNLAIGPAATINTTRTAQHTTEQWIYRYPNLTRYFYFEDGVLRTIQN